MPFDIKLAEVGTNKINTIKAIRTALHNGLYEAKCLADAAPTFIARNLSSGEVENFRTIFAGVARIEVTPNRGGLPLSKFNRISIELPDTGPVWVPIGELKLGEIVTTSNTLLNITRDDLRIITENGALSFEGRIVANFSDGTFYQRLPVGTKVSLTLN